jgi:hypothetical protein
LKLLFGKQRNHFVQDDKPSSGVFLSRAKNLSFALAIFNHRPEGDEPWQMTRINQPGRKWL